MKQQRNFPILVVSPKGERTLKSGHPWVYDNVITKQLGDFPNGCLADVVGEKGNYLGTGLYSEKSKIRLRLLSDNANETFRDAFFERRVRYAIEYRRQVMGDDFGACRLIFGESDGLPGVTVDLFNDLLSAEILSFGMEQRKDVIYRALASVLKECGVEIRGIFERNESQIRTLEGLPTGKGWYESESIPHSGAPVTEITENGIRYTVDVENGQKTGFFLDQKYNRKAVMRLAKGKRVLDCFTHTGSFALNAAMGGAEWVTAVDISETAVKMANENAVLNGLDGKMSFVCADVFDLLPKLAEEGKKPYDFIILDPPAFTKSRKTVGNAEKGYKEINYRALKLLPRGGYFATCSCSHFMRNDLFVEMLKSAAADAGVSLKQIEMRQQCPDHPILWNVPETDYLKFYLFQIV
ncbi:MAG: class I SAM-dependent rRNA methyltransferase [Lachnospiraceae bacterium]|nr:class I SAM-dependent rRNA methyltransferase [Lachnospiraceae bacterium]